MPLVLIVGETPVPATPVADIPVADTPIPDTPVAATPTATATPTDSPTADATATDPPTATATPTDTPTGTATATPVSVPAPAAIRVWYRLDPWLISGNYGGGFWAAPAVLGPTTQGTSTFVVQARARADDQVGSPITDARWVPADPAMVGVSPDLGAEVTITVRRAGRSRLQLASQNGAKELVIAAEYRSEAIVVQIAQ